MCALLDKLKIRPFSYKMAVKKVYEDGQIYEPSILDISPADIRSRFQTSISNMAAISLASGYITKPALPHLLVNAFKNLAAVTFEADYSFKQADKLKDAAKNAGKAKAPDGKPKAEEKKPKVEEKVVEEADALEGGLGFGMDDGY